MPIRTADTILFLDGHCPIEEAEALHEAMRGIDEPVFDLAEATYLHTAIVQLILASKSSVRGVPADPVLAACFRDRGAA